MKEILKENLKGALYLLESNEERIINESSMADTISVVASPFKRSSPRALNAENVKIRALQSFMVDFNLLSMSCSFTAAMQISF